jgi:hypothetical protein
MNTMTMPGFTAEASLYKRGGFGMATVTGSPNTTERVQPALTCFDMGVQWSDAINRDDQIAAFWAGFAQGYGCHAPGR